VICSEVFEHIRDAPVLFDEMTRVLRPGGTLILGTPDYGRWLWWVLEWIYGKILPGAYSHEHITHYTRASLTQRLRGAATRSRICSMWLREMIFQATSATQVENCSVPGGGAPGRDTDHDDALRIPVWSMVGSFLNVCIHRLPKGEYRRPGPVSSLPDAHPRGG
jgi:SAM-dependent methyltransferase